MKLSILLLTVALSLSLSATEGKKEDEGKVIQTAKKVSGETKRALRKIGRKSMDATCELTEGKESCERQKAEHERLNKKEEVEGVPGN